MLSPVITARFTPASNSFWSKSPIQNVYNNTPKETGLAPQISNLVSEPSPLKKKQCVPNERDEEKEKKY